MRNTSWLLLALLIVLTACSSQVEEKKKTVETAESEDANQASNELEEQEEKEQEEQEEQEQSTVTALNSSGNVNAGGNYLVVDDWIYFANIFSNHHLYKMKLDGTDSVQLTDYPVGNLHIAGDWLYYLHMDYSTGYPLHQSLNKMKLDGSEEHVVINQPIGNVYASGDYLLFIIDGTVYKLNVNDDQMLELPYTALSMSIYEETIIYYDHDGYHQGNIDGTMDEFLFQESNGDFTLMENDLYYTVLEGDSGLFRYSLKDGTLNNPVSEGIYFFNVDEDYIYYSPAGPMVDQTLYKADKDGKLISDLQLAVNSVNVFGDYIVGDYARQGFGSYVLMDLATNEVRKIEPVQ